MDRKAGNNMHISYKPLWHTLLERDMRKEDLRLAAGKFKWNNRHGMKWNEAVITGLRIDEVLNKDICTRMW